jgi:hypothetical protein
MVGCARVLGRGGVGEADWARWLAGLAVREKEGEGVVGWLRG